MVVCRQVLTDGGTTWPLISERACVCIKCESHVRKPLPQSLESRRPSRLLEHRCMDVDGESVRSPSVPGGAGAQAQIYV